MQKVNKYKDKNILILGLAVSGYSSAKLLHELGATVTVNDFKNLDGDSHAEKLEQLGIKIVSGGHPLSLLDDDVDIIVKNPGIPYSNPMIRKAKEAGIKIITDIEVASELTDSYIIAVTGTNGKTTTTKMIESILLQQSEEGHIYTVGNIGNPVSDIVKDSSQKDTLLIESSSFQLMGTVNFKPSIAVFTNIHSAHLDYHGSRREYIDAKLNITRNQTEEDYIVYNHDQIELNNIISSTSKAQLIPFSRKSKLKNGVYLDDNNICYNGEVVLSVDDITLPGYHNLENAMASIAVAKLRFISNENIKKGLRDFHGVPHRMHFIGEINGRKFYNDSKATNSISTKNALESFNKNVLLIAGGLDRGADFEDLLPVFRKHVKAIYTFGETRQKIADIGKQSGVDLVCIEKNLRNCVKAAYKNSQENDVILLSPACASWDSYSDYQARGTDFIKTVKEIERELEEGE